MRRNALQILGTHFIAAEAARLGAASRVALPGFYALDTDYRHGGPIGENESDIAKIRAAGGDIVPSFGGYSADHAGTEIAGSCPSVALIAPAYEKVITTYNVTRLDLHTEDNSLTDTAGVDRRVRRQAA